MESIAKVSVRKIFWSVWKGNSKHIWKRKRTPLWRPFNLIEGANNLESFDTFVTDLKLLARGLDIAESDKLIRNAIACKSLDERVRQKCLEKSKGLTLDTAIDIGRMFEATKDGVKVMAGEDPRVEINTLAGKNVAPRNCRKAKQSESKGKPQARKCMRRGYNSHKQNEKCMAKNASCRRCNKIGHFASVCKSTKVHSLEENYSSDEEEGLDQDMHLLRVTGLEVNGVNDSPAKGENDEWWESVQVNDHTLQCQLDTGAYASVLNNNNNNDNNNTLYSPSFKNIYNGLTC